MSEVSALSFAAKPRDRSIEARRKARALKGQRERLVIEYLNCGVGVAEIAQRTGVTEKRMRATIREIVGRRRPVASEEFIALQVNRLNEALLVAYGAMSPENLGAVRLVVQIVRELDRYHGFVPARRPVRGRNDELEPPADPRHVALQVSEKTPFAPGDAQTPDGAAGPVAALHRPSRRGRPFGPPTERGGAAPVPGMAPQAPEIAQSAPGNGAPPVTLDQTGGAAGPVAAFAERGDAVDDHADLPVPCAAPQAIEIARSGPGNGMPPGAVTDAPASAAVPVTAPQALEIAGSATGKGAPPSVEEEDRPLPCPPAPVDGPPCIATDGYIRLLGRVWPTYEATATGL